MDYSAIMLENTHMVSKIKRAGEGSAAEVHSSSHAS